MKKLTLMILSFILIWSISTTSNAAEINSQDMTITMNVAERIKTTDILPDIQNINISNTKIARIKDDQLIGIKKGTTILKCILQDNNEVTFKVTTQQPVKKIKIKAKTKVLKIGQKTKLTATIAPKNANIKDVTWKSSNPKIASINSKGKVTAKKAGNVTITATTKDGSKVKSKIKLKIKEKYTKEELRYVSAIIFSEAGNQCYAGKKAVGIVVINRKESKVWPNSVKEVLYQRGQFTPAYNGSLNKSLQLYDSGKLNKDCIKAAKEVLNGSKTICYNKKQINMKNYYYFSRYVSGCRLKIQDHQFK